MQLGCSSPQAYLGENQSLKAIKESDYRYTLALNDFNKSLNNAFTKNEPNLKKASYEAASKVSTYNSCLKIVSLMAWDKVSSKNETESYFQEKISPILDPANAALSHAVDSAMTKFSEDLHKNANQLKADIDSINGSIYQQPSTLDSGLSSNVASDEELNKFSINALKVSGSVVKDRMREAFQVDKIVKNQVLKPAKNLFAKPVVKVLFATSAARMPLVAGQVVAVISAGSTAYDIYDLQHDFKRELNKLIAQSEAEQVQSLKIELDKYKAESLLQFKELQSTLISRN